MSSPRSRNRRGQGLLLREEILVAARALVQDQGEHAVTLRAVARTVGISAPSIYAHFPDRDAIVDTLVDEAFDELGDAVAADVEAQTDPVLRLRACCVAYVDFALSHPSTYRLAFTDHPTKTAARPTAMRTFELLVAVVHDCAEAGVSTCTDPFGDATAIWVALHGYIVMRRIHPAFPWPDEDAMLDRIINRLSAVDGASSGA